MGALLVMAIPDPAAHGQDQVPLRLRIRHERLNLTIRAIRQGWSADR